MKQINIIFLTMILCCLGACQLTSVPEQASLPTRVVFPTDVPLMTVTLLPTRALRSVATNTLNAPIPAATFMPATALNLQPAPTFIPADVPAITPIFTPFVQNLAMTGAPAPAPIVIIPIQSQALNSAAGPVIVTPTMPPSTPSFNDPLAAFVAPDYVFGKSVQGRDLVSRSIGDGTTILMLVGGIHGGWESNTTELISELILYFQNTPSAVLPGMRLVLIPTLNPDGLTLGRTIEGRFNANGVDLNRNWGCDWQADAVFRETPVNPGASAFSEPESVGMAAYILQIRPATVLFYHSAANGVFSGDCPSGNISGPMSAVYGQATGYTYGTEFTSYPVTGTASTWVDGLGIPAADVELANTTDTDFERNLAGIMALQCWLLGDAAAGLEQCQ